jgi:hypothetical protein
MSETTSRRFWISMIIGFFAIDLSIAVIAVSMASADPSFRAIPGFGTRSVNWTELQRRQNNLRKLGILVEFDLENSTPEGLRVRVLDSDRHSIEGLNLTMQAFHFTRVAEQQTVDLIADEVGYIAPLKMSKHGNWHVELSGEAMGEPIWSQQTIDWKGPGL